MRRFLRLLLLTALATQGTGGLLADEPRAPPLKAPVKPSLPAWGEARRDCLEWRNGCQVCTRDAQGGAACSTPGIACTAGEPVCVRTK